MLVMNDDDDEKKPITMHVLITVVLIKSACPNYCKCQSNQHVDVGGLLGLINIYHHAFRFRE